MNWVAAGAVTLEVHEKMAVGRWDGLHQVDETAITPKSQRFEAPPLEPSHAENESGRVARTEQLDTQALTFLSSGEYENRVGFFRRLCNVEKRQKRYKRHKR